MRWAILIILLASCIPSARADEDAVIAAWIVKLAQDDFKERQKASKALEQFGDRAVVALRDVIRSGDLEARRRAEEILRRIVAQRIRASFTHPREVHLRFEMAPLAEVEKEIQRIFGPEVLLSPANQRNTLLTADTGKRPLWQAIEELARQTKLSFTPRHASLGDPQAVEPDAFLTLSHHWTMDVKPATSPFRWADRSGAVLFLASQPRVEMIDILAIPDTRLHPLRSIRSMRLTQYRDRSGKVVMLPERLLQSELVQKPSMTRIHDAADVTRPPTLYRASFPSKVPLEFETVEGFAACEVHSLDDVLTIRNLVKAEGKTIHEPKIGVRVTIHEVDFQSDADLRLKVHVRNFDRYIRLPDTPEVIRLKPGVLVVRGPADYVAESVHVVDGHGAAHTGRLVEQSRHDKDGVHLWLQFTVPAGSRPDLALLIANARRDVIEVPFTLRPAQ